MKKTLILALLFAGGLMKLDAQNLYVNAGLNVSSMRIDFYDPVIITDWYPVYGPQVMISYEHRFNRAFSFRPGLVYSRQGRRTVSDLGPSAYVEYKYLVDFIDFPVLFTYNFNPRSTGGYYINTSGGIYLGYGVNGNKVEDITALVSKDPLFEGPDKIFRNDYGLMFVGGFGDDENQIALTLQYGFRNMATTDSDYTKFARFSVGLNYVKVIPFGSNARRLMRKRYFRSDAGQGQEYRVEYNGYPQVQITGG